MFSVVDVVAITANRAEVLPFEIDDPVFVDARVQIQGALLEMVAPPRHRRRDLHDERRRRCVVPGEARVIPLNHQVWFDLGLVEPGDEPRHVVHGGP